MSDVTSTRRWWILGALALALLVAGLDATVLNLALSDISRALGASNTDLQWVTNGYILVFAVSLMPAGTLGDRIGRSRVLVIGLLIFVIASAFGAWASSPTMLIVCRVVMGLGAAATFPLALSIIPTVFSPQERSKAVAVITAAMGIGMPVGPLLGGWLLDRFWWGSTLLINVPVGLVALIAIAVLVPNSRAEHPAPVDVRGLLLSAVGIAATVYAFVEQPVHGFGSTGVAVPLALGVVMLAAFVVVQRHTAAPLVDRALARSRMFVGGTLATTVGSFVLLGLLFTLPLYLQAIRGESAFDTGLQLMPLMLALVVGSGAAPILQRRFGPAMPVSAGLLVTAGGLLVALTISAAHTGLSVVVALVIIGFGFGLAMPPAQDAVLGALPRGHESSGTGLNQAVKQLGGALSIAILGSIVTSTYRSGVEPVAAHLPGAVGDAVRESVAGATAVADRLPAGLGATIRSAAAEAYVSGMHTAVVVCAIVAVVAAVTFAVLLPGRGSATAATVEDAEPAETTHPA